MLKICITKDLLQNYSVLGRIKGYTSHYGRRKTLILQYQLKIPGLDTVHEDSQLNQSLGYKLTLLLLRTLFNKQVRLRVYLYSSLTVIIALTINKQVCNWLMCLEIGLFFFFSQQRLRHRMSGTLGKSYVSRCVSICPMQVFYLGSSKLWGFSVYN